LNNFFLYVVFQEAEEHNFTSEDVQVALEQTAEGDTPGQDPITWLRQHWRNLIDTVATLATNYGLERAENTVGVVSALEARDALRQKKGNVWSAVTHCVEQRQSKVRTINDSLF
jgi:E3 ubiquitin-protein ligase RNF31